MSKAFYAGVSGISRKIVKAYGGVDGVARKIRKGYIGVDGIARQFYVSEVFVFDGTFTVSRVNIDGVPHDLYTLTDAGQLYLGRNAKYWMTGGGASGATGVNHSLPNYTSGNGGGGGYVKSGELKGGKYTVLVGAGGTDNQSGTESSIISNAETLSAAGGSSSGAGGSGGGGAVRGQATTTVGYAEPGGSGDAVSTYPFGLTDLLAHSAGGGSGSAGHQQTTSSTRYYNNGVAGGSDGSDGVTGANSRSKHSSSYGSTAGGAGGSYGGGVGGSISHANHTGSSGSSATYYGSGGGGAGVYYYTTNVYRGEGGAGYQGIVYIAVPADIDGDIVITEQPQSVTALVGDTITFAVEASGTGLTYQWQWRANDTDAWRNTSLTGNQTATITAEATTARNGYQYRCTIYDASGNMMHSDVVTLTVVSILITKQPENQVAVGGDTVTFNVEAIGAVAYQWQVLAASGNWNDLTWEGATTATMTRTLNITTVTYTYRCKLTAADGTVVYTDMVGFTSP